MSPHSVPGRPMKRIFTSCFCIACVSASCLTAHPKPTRAGITITALATVGHASVRIRRDPSTGNLYILQNDGNILRVVFGAGGLATDTVVYRPSDDGVNAPLGMAFAKDGTMFLVGNDSTGVLGREWLRSNGYLFSEGTRNTFDFAYAGNGDLFHLHRPT